MDTFHGVADTLYLPLTARIFVSERFPEYFYDEKALSLKEAIPYDAIRKKTSEYFEMAGACRFRELDLMIADFLKAHETCNVVNIGCGLETAYFRVKPDASRVTFYEMDLPEVIEARKKVLGESENEILIGGDMFDFAWAERIDRTNPTLITVIGVFQYFEPKRVTTFLKQAKETFSDAQFIFDAMTYKALKKANDHVRKTGNTSAQMYFGVDDPRTFAKECGMTLLAQRPFFATARRMLKGRLKLYTRIAMKVVDEGSMRGYLIHLR